MKKVTLLMVSFMLGFPVIAHTATGWPWWPWRVKADMTTWDRGLSIIGDDEWEYIVFIPSAMKSEEMPPPAWLKNPESWKLVPTEGLRVPLIVKTPRLRTGESRGDFWKGIEEILSQHRIKYQQQ